MGPDASDLVIVSRALVELAEFLQGRQEAAGRGRVILDRREGDRRVARVVVDEDRRRNDRRQVGAPGAEALMRILGFSVVPSAVPPDGTVKRPAARGVPRGASTPRSRLAAAHRSPRRRR
jgi:hypothetical protein